jgi:alkanesulfonate monooxygenase SsuD/methylene tetrahydromethanopterin reductase-like flavin-dependent oxidoreductase (luciferase family)/hemerythrin-like domain-containing protein
MRTAVVPWVTMTDFGHDLLFGAFITPDAGQAETVLQLAEFCDRLGLDILGVQDHPYQPGFLDMWTLLSAVASRTEHLRLFPDVANLPLRPPAVLAGAAASLDIISSGRVELGLGSGAFGPAIAAMGGPERAPGEAVEALEEAIRVVRALWTPGRPVTFDGKYYSLHNAQPGPFPVHPIGIWLGSYKPRMLRLTGRLADGWVPTVGYAAPSDFPGMTRIIDDAASSVGRSPGSVRRVYNISGQFTEREQGFLQGPPELWIAQLTDLVLEFGFSAFLLAPGGDAAGDLERFAAEVAPGVREAVEAIRRGELQARPAAPQPDHLPIEVTRSTADAPTSPLLPEAHRPHVEHTGTRATTSTGIASAQTLVQVHDHLRHELAEIQSVAAQVAQGGLTPEAARSILNRMTIRQNFWTLGSFCAQYCRVVTVHHTIEDRIMFPALQREDDTLTAVLGRLGEEHEIIAEVTERLDEALVAMLTEPSGVQRVRRVADELSDALLSHLAYEENELLGPLERSSIVV